VSSDEQVRYIVNQSELPEQFPTHKHASAFWESLGRAVATFGFLEETLTKAIFSFTATKPYDESEIEQAFKEWVPKLERSLSDTLGSLIDTYGKAVREHPDSTITNLEDLLNDLREASRLRNVLCHGSWKMPNSDGASIPFFVNRQNEIFQTPIDQAFINQVQKAAIGLACQVINTVTHMGWQFPSSAGPGRAIWDAS
jgi:hypothetical protein